jgi:hypothetical protein
MTMATTEGKSKEKPGGWRPGLGAKGVVKVKMGADPEEAQGIVSSRIQQGGSGSMVGGGLATAYLIKSGRELEWGQWV